MFVRTKKKSSGKTAVQIVESQRSGASVVQSVVRYVGQAETKEQLEELVKLADAIIGELMHERSQPYLPGINPETINTTTKDLHLESEKAKKFEVDVRNLREEQRVITGIHEVFGKLYETLGFDRILPEADEVLRSSVLARIANPTSKLRTAAYLEEDYGIKLSVDRIYRMMNKLAKKEEAIKKLVGDTTLSLFQEPVNILFFDVTTLYFESFVTDDLRHPGYSKDNKFKEGQVVLSLVTTRDGMPITYDLFPGNTYEGHTLITMIESLEKRFEIANIILVADRAMFNEENLKLMESKKIKYIVAAKLRSLPEKKKKEILGSKLYAPVTVEQELHWVKDFEHKERRLVVSFNSSRARKDSFDRQRLIDRLMKKVKDDKVKLTDVIQNRGTNKFLKVESGCASIDEEKIQIDKDWDGIHGVITNIEDQASQEILSRYRGLWQIEEAFRINKHDLRMRPIYHWSKDRIRAHIALCFLAFTLVKQAIHRIKIQSKSMSFDSIKNHLLHAQASILIDTKTKRKYIVPSKATADQKRIYSVFGLTRKDLPYLAK
jgi:transposase